MKRALGAVGLMLLVAALGFGAADRLATARRRGESEEIPLLFEQARFQEKADFRVVGVVSQTISREESALQAAAVDIARAIVSLAVDRF